MGWQPELNTPCQHHRRAAAAGVPGDLAVEERLASLMRWNALAMVVRANQAYGELVGISPATPARPICSRPVSTISSMPAKGWSRASTAATWCSFSRTARPACTRAPSFEGFLSEQDLLHFRQEITAHGGVRGLCSYPHPWSMPDFGSFRLAPWA